MAILKLKQLQIGRVGDNPQKLIINTDDTIATVTTAGYLTKYGSSSNVSFSDHQLAEVYTTDGKVGLYQVSVDDDGIASLLYKSKNVITPTVAGNFANFDDTDGTLIDSGYSPSDDTKSIVGMVDGATIAGNFAVYSDTAGTTEDLNYSPTNESKTKVVMADDATVVDELAAFADTEGTVKTTGILSGFVLQSDVASPLPNVNIVRFNPTISAGVLAGGNPAQIIDSSGTLVFSIMVMAMNLGGVNFSGGGGDRDLAITDGTTVYSVIPAATLQSLVNAAWGSTNLPFPVAVGISHFTIAGADLYAQYTGGTTDYAAGSFILTGLAAHVGGNP